MRTPVAVALFALFVAPSASADRQDRYAAGAVKAQWEKLRHSQCKIEKADVATPIEARILRNTPFAIAGKIFKSPELTEVFSDDGSWYKPRKKAVKISNLDRFCVNKLKAWERKLRKQLPIKREVEAFISRDRRIYLDLRATVPYDKNYAEASSSISNGSFRWGFAYRRGCGKRGKPECGGYSIECEKAKGKIKCVLVAAG